MTDPHEQIRRRAHEIWEREGRPHGKHDEHWSQAEQEVRAESGQAAEAPAGTTAKRRGTAKGTRAAAENLSAVASGTSKATAAPAAPEQASPARVKATRKAKAAPSDPAAPAKAEKPAKPTASSKAPQAGRKDARTDARTDGRTDGRKGAAPH